MDKDFEDFNQFLGKTNIVVFVLVVLIAGAVLFAIGSYLLDLWW